MDVYRKINEAMERGEAIALCTVVNSKGSTPRRVGSKMLVYEDGRIEGSVGGGEMESRVISIAREVFVSGEPQKHTYNLTDPVRGDPGVCGGTMEIFVEPIYPESTIVVVGGGHVGKAVVHLAKWLGFRVVLTDDREAFCSPEMVPGADAYLSGPLSKLPEMMNVNPYSYLVLTTRNVMVDVEGLPAIFETPAPFIGVIGSRRRWATTREKLAAVGIPEEQLERVVSPMGLELNAETPEEIAVSIMAEIVMLMRGGDGARMGK
jgi:xanthine dehydrogenase accessory factor